MIKRKIELDYDEKKDEVRLFVVSDYSQLLEHNKELRKEQGKGISKSKVWRHIGRIPLDVLLSLPPELGLAILYGDKEAQDWFFKNFPEFRTSEGDL